MAVHAGLQKMSGNKGKVLGVLAQLGLRGATLLSSSLLDQLVVLHYSIMSKRKRKAQRVQLVSSAARFLHRPHKARIAEVSLSGSGVAYIFKPSLQVSTKVV